MTVWRLVLVHRGCGGPIDRGTTCRHCGARPFVEDMEVVRHEIGQTSGQPEPGAMPEPMAERLCDCTACPCNVPIEGRGYQCHDCKRGNHFDREGRRHSHAGPYTR